LLDFVQISYRLWSRTLDSITNVQGQRVTGQGNSATITYQHKTL